MCERHIAIDNVVASLRKKRLKLDCNPWGKTIHNRLENGKRRIAAVVGGKHMEALTVRRVPDLPWPGRLYTDDAHVDHPILRRKGSGHDQGRRSIRDDCFTELRRAGQILATMPDAPPVAEDKLPYFVQGARQLNSKDYCACGCNQPHHMNVPYRVHIGPGMEWHVLYFVSNSHKTAYLRKQNGHA